MQEVTITNYLSDDGISYGSREACERADADHARRNSTEIDQTELRYAIREGERLVKRMKYPALVSQSSHHVDDLDYAMITTRSGLIDYFWIVGQNTFTSYKAHYDKQDQLLGQYIIDTKDRVTWMGFIMGLLTDTDERIQFESVVTY